MRMLDISLSLPLREVWDLAHLDRGVDGQPGDETREGGHPGPGQLLLVVPHQVRVARLGRLQQGISLQINHLLQMKATTQLKLFHFWENISNLSYKYLHLALKCFAFYKNTPRQDWCRHIWNDEVFLVSKATLTELLSNWICIYIKVNNFSQNKVETATFEKESGNFFKEHRQTGWNKWGNSAEEILSLIQNHPSSWITSCWAENTVSVCRTWREDGGTKSVLGELSRIRWVFLLTGTNTWLEVETLWESGQARLCL